MQKFPITGGKWVCKGLRGSHSATHRGNFRLDAGTRRHDLQISAEISGNRKWQGLQISERISGNSQKAQPRPRADGSQQPRPTPTPSKVAQRQRPACAHGTCHARGATRRARPRERSADCGRPRASGHPPTGHGRREASLAWIRISKVAMLAILFQPKFKPGVSKTP